MKKQFLLLLCLAVAAFADFQDLTTHRDSLGRPVIIPLPQEYQLTSGNFTFPKTITISIPQEMNYDKERLTAVLKNRRPQCAIAFQNSPNSTFLFQLNPNLNLKSNEGYTLEVNDKQLKAQATTLTGLAYAERTIEQLLMHTKGPSLPQLTINDWPVLKMRGIYHNSRFIDKNNRKNIQKSFDLATALKCNTMLLEFSENIPLKNYPFNRAHLSREELLEIAENCKTRHLEIIPLIQCWSHVAWLEKHPKIREFLEKHDAKGWDIAYCPMNEEVVQLTKELIVETCNLFHPRYFHISLDELEWGAVHCCPKCSQLSVKELLTRHTLELEKTVLSCGAIPLVYHDTFYPGRSLKGEDVLSSLDKRTGITIWNYQPILNTRIPQWFAERQWPLFGMSGSFHLHNPRAMARMLRDFNAEGCFLSYWDFQLAHSLKGLNTISNRLFTGTVNQANYYWNPEAPLADHLPYDSAYEANRILEGRYSIPATYNFYKPLDISSSFNQLSNNCSKQPQLTPQQLQDLQSKARHLEEHFEIIGTQDGSYATWFPLNAKPGASEKVTIPLPPVKAEKLALLLTATIPRRSEFFASYGGARVMPNLGTITFTYANGKKSHINLVYNRNLPDWNSGFSGYDARLVLSGEDKEGNGVALNTLYHFPPKGSVLKSMEFSANGAEGIFPMLLALSVATPDQPPAVNKAPDTLPQLAALPDPFVKPHYETEIILDGDTPRQNFRVTSEDFIRKATFEYVKDPTSPSKNNVLKITVPPRPSLIGTARICVDIKTKAQSKFKSMVFDFRVDKSLQVWRTDCYVGCNNWKGYLTRQGFHHNGCNEWQHVVAPFKTMGKRGAGCTVEQIDEMRISFWMQNEEEVIITIDNVGFSTQPDAEDYPKRKFSK